MTYSPAYRTLLLVVILLSGCQKDKEALREGQDSLSIATNQETKASSEFLKSEFALKTNTYKNYLLQRLPSLLLVQSPFYSIADVTFQVNLYKENENILLVEEQTDFEDGGQSLKRFFLQNQQILLIEYLQKSRRLGKEKWEKTTTYFPTAVTPRVFQKEADSFQALYQDEEGWKEIKISNEIENWYQVEEKDMQELIAAANGTGNYVLFFQDIEDYGNGELYLRAATKEEHDVAFFIAKPDSIILKIQQNRHNFVGRFVKVVFTIQTIDGDRRAVYHHLKFLN